MKLSESWLREWVNPAVSREKLCQTLTMAGLEVEEIAPVAGVFSGVVIGEIIKVEKHPQADRLSLCEVNVGVAAPLHIVCGASNVKAGMKVAVAMINAQLPNNITIKPAAIRGTPSEGMLCSAKELLLAEESQGIIELPLAAPLGKNLRDFLLLDDHVIEIGLTPNRGDCLSIKGMAREIAALTQSPLTELSITKIKSTIKDTISINLHADKACPRYVGRVIRQVNANAITPIWMKEWLRRSGVRCISPIVDITNYVMIELGQPMHAFDLDTIKQEINVRLSKTGEQIHLLDESNQTLDANTLVIADAEHPLAIAGVMGGVTSSVTLTTRNILLESAYFDPHTIARQRQHYLLQSESAHRFERGVDPTLQQAAIERATQLILDIAGGEAGPIIEKVAEKNLPQRAEIKLTQRQVSQLLGLTIPVAKIETILKALHFSFKVTAKGENVHWQIQPPSYRFDMTLPEDVIEEIARFYGYDKIPAHRIKAALQLNHNNSLDGIRHVLRDHSYHEIISYSFVDKERQILLDPQQTPHSLDNPISTDMSVMRTNLWPGLLHTFLYNHSRQQDRIRLFEIGTCFLLDAASGQVAETMKLAGLISGHAEPDQWGLPAREVDFYDLKGNIENLLALHFPRADVHFVVDHHPALHPGQTAAIYINKQKIGVMGALHPSVLQIIDIPKKIFIFELEIVALQRKAAIVLQDISKFPEIRRDIAILVNRTVPSQDIQDTIRAAAGDWLKEIFIFDLYQGKEISTGLKSMAFTLILQHSSRTLVDDEIVELMNRIVTALKGQFGAELRS